MIAADWKLSVVRADSATVIRDLAALYFPRARTALDLTYGRGVFWRKKRPELEVLGMDRQSLPEVSVVGDFTAAPFADGSFDLVVLDPPYLTNTGRTNRSAYESRFASYPTPGELWLAVTAGALEARRLARQGFIVKVQDHVHNQRVIWMDQWVIEAVGWPCDRQLTVRRPFIDPKWRTQRHLKRVHAVYLVYLSGCQYHGQPCVALGGGERRGEPTNGGLDIDGIPEQPGAPRERPERRLHQRRHAGGAGDGEPAGAVHRGC